jgi:uroporphyrin-III C-methyltransferase
MHDSPSETRRTSKRGAWSVFAWVIGFALVSVLLLWQWYDGHSRINALREEFALRLRESEVDSRDARLSARQSQEAVREAQARVAQLEVKVAEYQNQQGDLEALYKELSRSRDERVLIEIEQMLTIASQQLQAVGNVPAALAAIQAADARLARSRRAQFLPLRKAFAHDIEQLKGASGSDIPGIAAKLDQVIAAVDSLPLAQDARPLVTGAARPESEGLWGRLVADLLGQLKQLVRIQNVEGADPVLLGPSQAFFLRENLKLRLLNARLGLLARDEAAYRGDLRLAVSWIERYFDTRSRDAATMTGTLKQLGSVRARVLFPTISESLAAVRGYRASHEQAAQ